MRNKLYIDKADDRDSVVAALARNGYSVKISREKDGNKYRHYVEYWRDA